MICIGHGFHVGMCNCVESQKTRSETGRLQFNYSTLITHCITIIRRREYCYAFAFMSYLKTPLFNLVTSDDIIEIIILTKVLRNIWAERDGYASF